MQIIEFDKNSIFTDQDLKQFFRENDFLFPDPFANHIELDTYMDKLIRYGVILIAEEDQKILGISCSYMNDYQNCELPEKSTLKQLKTVYSANTGSVK